MGTCTRIWYFEKGVTSDLKSRYSQSSDSTGTPYTTTICMDVWGAAVCVCMTAAYWWQKFTRNSLRSHFQLVWMVHFPVNAIQWLSSQCSAIFTWYGRSARLVISKISISQYAESLCMGSNRRMLFCQAHELFLITVDKQVAVFSLFITRLHCTT